jgi:3-mercaptopyruvate sulfurtransferase SseA
MNQRLVYIAGSVLAAALFIFAIWHATQRKAEPAAAAPQASATAPVATASEDPNAAAPRIEPDDLYAHFQKGDVTIIDVRDAEAFAAAHIPGALNIPLARIDGEVSSLPKGKAIVAYCT